VLGKRASVLRVPRKNALKRVLREKCAKTRIFAHFCAKRQFCAKLRYNLHSKLRKTVVLRSEHKVRCANAFKHAFYKLKK